MYIVSLTHTMRHEKYVTLWRPNNSGYCYSKEMAGFYENPEYGYHDNDDNKGNCGVGQSAPPW